jgi:2'-5' RNA ligase
MPQTTRTFVAFTIPEASGRKLVQLQQELAPLVPGFRWSALQPFHATLAFLGDVKDRDLGAVCKAVEAGALAATESEAMEAIELELQGLGAFPSPTKARVVWAGITAPSLKPLLDLQKSIVRALSPTGYRPDEKEFHPHITLGRIKANHSRGPVLTDVIERFRNWTGGSFAVSEITAFASTLGPQGPTHTPLLRVGWGSQKKDELPT